MSALSQQFAEELTGELEDLWDQAEARVQCCERRLERHELRKHVCFGNVAVLRNEECCFRGFIREMKKIAPPDEATLDEIASMVKNLFRERVARNGFAPCAYLFAERKIEEVRHRLEPKGTPDDGSCPGSNASASPNAGTN